MAAISQILIDSVMASKQRRTEKPEELYLLSEAENKQSKKALVEIGLLNR